MESVVCVYPELSNNLKESDKMDLSADSDATISKNRLDVNRLIFVSSVSDRLLSSSLMEQNPSAFRCGIYHPNSLVVMYPWLAQSAIWQLDSSGCLVCSNISGIPVVESLFFMGDIPPKLSD
jgi:hypothetical protein